MKVGRIYAFSSSRATQPLGGTWPVGRRQAATATFALSRPDLCPKTRPALGAEPRRAGLRRRKDGVLRRLGADAVVADALDRRTIEAEVLAARPEVIVHEMTDLKAASDLRTFDRSFAASNRLRTEGADHLLAAARKAGVQRFLAQSFCGWPYARAGGAVKTEADPLDPDPPKKLARALAAIRYLEGIVTQSNSPEGIVLRYGAFYGDNTGLFDGPLLEQIRRRRAPVIGSGNGWWSFVHIDDAAQATALAIERGVGGAIYNIVDDEPAPVREWLPVLAKLLSAKPPRDDRGARRLKCLPSPYFDQECAERPARAHPVSAGVRRHIAARYFSFCVFCPTSRARVLASGPRLFDNGRTCYSRVNSATRNAAPAPIRLQGTN